LLRSTERTRGSVLKLPTAPILPAAALDFERRRLGEGLAPVSDAVFAPYQWGAAVW
jgi:hypothetical protein